MGPKYSNDRVILRPNVERSFYDILRDIFSGARGMLKSLCNHEAGSSACRHHWASTTNQEEWRIAGAGRCREKVSHDD